MKCLINGNMNQKYAVTKGLLANGLKSQHKQHEKSHIKNVSSPLEDLNCLMPAYLEYFDYVNIAHCLNIQYRKKWKEFHGKLSSVYVLEFLMLQLNFSC